MCTHMDRLFPVKMFFRNFAQSGVVHDTVRTSGGGLQIFPWGHQVSFPDYHSGYLLEARVRISNTNWHAPPRRGLFSAPEPFADATS